MAQVGYVYDEWMLLHAGDDQLENPERIIAIRNELIDRKYLDKMVHVETKFITKEHVQFENGQVLNIDGLDANIAGVFFTRAIPIKRPTMLVRDSQPKDKIYRHFENWCKYLDEYRKYIVSSAKSSHTTIQTSSYMSNCLDSEGYSSRASGLVSPMMTEI